MEAAKNNNNERTSNGSIHGPTNPMVTPLLNDLYQFTMAYAYWKANKHQERAVLVFLSSFLSNFQIQFNFCGFFCCLMFSFSGTCVLVRFFMFLIFAELSDFCWF